MKLVRENVAKRIYKETPEKITQPCDQDEYNIFLKLKLSEELGELRDSKYADISEYADVLEVLHTMAISTGLDWNKILDRKDEKLRTEGSFSSGYIYKN
jgi:predicted house-cleaning noncanonical NTP pyrophosphatase (MazG superfamily)